MQFIAIISNKILATKWYFNIWKGYFFRGNNSCKKLIC